MNKSRLVQSIERLMALHQIKDPTELAREAGMNQPTLHRIMTGQIKQPKDSTLSPLTRYFRVSMAQLKGDEFYAPANPDLHVSAKALKLARKWDALPPHKQKAVADLIEALSQAPTPAKTKTE